MICPRCGTEHEDPAGVCPRCGYGRQKEAKPLPKWVILLCSAVGALLITGGIVSAYIYTHYNSNWIGGSWEGTNLAITFNTDEHSFLLSNGDTVLSGDYSASRDAFTLTAEDGSLYVYRYKKINSGKMKLMYSRGNETVKVTVNKVVSEQDADELDSEVQ